MTKRNLIEITPLFILIGGLIYTLIVTTFQVEQYEIKFWGALAFTIISGLVYLKWKKRYNSILGFTLVLGTLNLIRFLPTTITIGAGIGETAISLQLFPFFTLLIFFYINRRRVKQLISNIIKNKPLTEEEVAEQRELRIEAFKKKFGGKTIIELSRISNSTDTLDQNAVEAANRLLSERSND